VRLDPITLIVQMQIKVSIQVMSFFPEVLMENAIKSKLIQVDSFLQTLQIGFVEH
jgi:hypothetical protein